MVKRSAIHTILDLREALIEEARGLEDGPNVDAVRHAVMAVAGSISAVRDAFETNERLTRDDQ